MRRLVNIEGNIGAGKSTAIRAWARDHDDVVAVIEPTDANPLFRMRMENAAYADLMQAWMLCDRVRMLLEAMAPRDGKRALLDRGFPCDQIFVWAGSSDEFRLKYDAAAAEVGLALKACGYVPTFVYFALPGATCLKRIAARGRPEEAALDLAYLDRLDAAYAQFFGARGPNVTVAPVWPPAAQPALDDVVPPAPGRRPARSRPWPTR